MKKLILLSILLTVWVGTARTWAAADPADRFLDAYLLVQDGDGAERQSEWANANAKYTAALDILREISTTSSNWNPHVIEFRTKYCVDHLNSLKGKLAAPATGASTPVPVPAPVTAAAVAAPAPAPTPARVTPPVAPKPASAEVVVTPSAEIERVQHLTVELQRAQDKIREIEAARTDLKSKLDEALAKAAAPAPVPIAPVPVTDTRVADLTKQNLELSTQLATAQAQTAHLKEKLQAAGTPVAPVAPVTTVAAPDMRMAELTKQNQELSTKLATAQAQMAELQEKLQVALKPPVPAVPVVVPAAPVESAELNQLRAELRRAQDKARELEAARTDLKSKLDEALAKAAAPAPAPVVSAPVADTQVAKLTKQNQELSRQLTAMQSELNDMRGQLKVAATPAAPAVAPAVVESQQLRAEIQRTKDELIAAHKNIEDLSNEKSALDQRYQSMSARLAETEEKLHTAKPGIETEELVLVKKQLEQSQQRIADMQKALEIARADAMRAQRAADEAATKLDDSVRQLHAVKTASAKNEQVIKQLQDENAILREVRENFGPRRVEEGNTPRTVYELKGWRPRNRQPQSAKPAGGAAVTSASNQGKVSATIPAPAKSAPAKESGWWLWKESPTTNAVTNAVVTPKQTPKQSVSPWWWPFGNKTAAPVTNKPPVVATPAATVTK